MPELPEVETTVQGIKPHVEGETVKQVIIRQHQLRWPITKNLVKHLQYQTILTIHRRAKYLCFATEVGNLIIHLGMSGRLRILTMEQPPQAHDHVDIILTNGKTLRYTDPRRFGAILWTSDAFDRHPLLRELGPEPLSPAFSGQYLHQKISRKSTAIKSLIMDSKIVVGVGNIYAAEALFEANIHPAKQAKQLSLEECARLVKAIKRILRSAIRQGGTTLKDFLNSEGKPGYFSQFLKVYGRSNLPCFTCGTLLKTLVLQNRSTVICETCQPLF